MSCGGKHLHIATLMRKYTRGLSTSTRPDLVVPAAETVLTDGRTDVKKRCVFWKKVFLVRTGPNWTDISVLWTHFSVLSDAVRTALSKKRYVWRKKAFACLRCMGKSSKDKLSPKLSNAPACPQLSVETYPHACNNERAKRVQNPKQGRSKPWHQTRKREPILWKSLLLHLQAAKTKMAPATMSCKLAMWHIYLISTVSAVPPWVNITNMQKTVLDFKKSTFGKKCIFSWKTPKIKGRWRVKVY